MSALLITRFKRTPAPVAVAFAAAISLFSCATIKDPYPNQERPAEDRYVAGAVVRTSYGFLRGQPDREGCYVWRGVPYAKPPVGDLRWRAPMPPDRWTGVKPARKFGKSAVQFYPLIGILGGSEDCLHLNVWRPADERENLPVLFWIHGGANTAGSSNASDYYGYSIASSQGLVFVSVDYRLGPLGWFLDPALNGADSSAAEASGNYGLLDIIAALRWVRDEIRSFGGDPDRVTVMGESAGALNVLALLCADDAAGLFAGAVAMSPLTTSHGMDEATERSRAILVDLISRDKKRKGRGYADPVRAAKAAHIMGPAERAAYLRSMKPERLYASLRGGITGMADWPTVYLDGAFLPREGFRAFASGNFPGKVPLIIGSTRDEIGVFLFLDQGISFDGAEYAAALRFGSDLWRARYVDEVALAISSLEEGPPVYSYRFDWGSPGADGKSILPFDLGARVGAFHSLDVPFFLGTDTVIGPILGNFVLTPENRPLKEALSSRIGAYLGSFTRTGNPNGPWAEPAWPEYGESGGKWLALGDMDSPGIVTVKEGRASVDEIAASMLRELGEDGATRAMFFLPFFMKGFPFQAP